MRDQRRDEDSYRESYRDSHYRRGESESERRPTFSNYSKSQRTADLGVKIKGRATADSAEQSPTRTSRPGGTKGLQRDEFREPSISPHRGHNRERPPKRSGKPGDSAAAGRRHYRGDSKISPARRRSPSNSPYRGASNHRATRRRSVSPGRRIVTGRPNRSTSRNRDRDYSSPRTSKANRYPYEYDDISDPTAGDSYVPPAKRYRAGSPKADPNRNSSRRGVLSDRNISQPDTKPPGHHYRSSTRDWTSRKDRDPDSSRYRRNSRSRDRSPPRYHDTRRRRREHRSSSPAPSGRRRKHSRSPIQYERASCERSKMQSSTRPIQSILDEGSRPPSPPRPIPTFDSDSHDSGAGAVRDTFPMHGMKASDVHGSLRSGRAQQIDTRQSYSASPQWTPTSSHHGSPQSGSPFSHGRGAWNGQSQHFHGQQRLVLYSFPRFQANRIVIILPHILPPFAKTVSLHNQALRASSTHTASRVNTIPSSSKYSLASRAQPSEEGTQVIEETISTNLRIVGFQDQDLQTTGLIPQGAEAAISKTFSGPLAVAVEGEDKQIQLMLRTINRDIRKALHNCTSNSHLTPQLHLQTRMAITPFDHRRICRSKIKVPKTRTFNAGFLLAVRRCYLHRAKPSATMMERKAPKLSLPSKTKVRHLQLPSLYRI